MDSAVQTRFRWGFFFLVSIVQLVDFRMVVSQMLGVDATALALPNSEIIKLLETLLHTHHHHHHLHHHADMPWHCPTHQRPCLAQIQDLPTGHSSPS